MILKYLWFYILCALLLIATLAQARDPAQVRAFRKVNPCPSTGKTSGACQGWVVDHIIPLCWGGDDAPANMQWQEQKASYIKDKFEREACALKKATGLQFKNFDELLCYNHNGTWSQCLPVDPPPCYLTYEGCEKESEKK